MKQILQGIKLFNWLMLVTALVVLIVGLCNTGWAQETAAHPEKATDNKSSMETGLAFIAAAMSVGIACIGAGLAVSAVGSAAMGAVAERPELMGRSLIYVGLAEGIAIYGLIVSIMILGKV